MRIIGGEARGRRLVAPQGSETRPTADKTRESLFNILMRDVPNAGVLDLFGGTGALGLEAMSRGAASCVICDFSAAAIKAINQNVSAVMGEKAGVTVIKADYRAALSRLKGEKYDLVFLDPPYKMQEAYAYALSFLLENDMLGAEAIIACERESKFEIPPVKGLKKSDSRLYRDTAIDFFIPEADE